MLFPAKLAEDRFKVFLTDNFIVYLEKLIPTSEPMYSHETSFYLIKMYQIMCNDPEDNKLDILFSIIASKIKIKSFAFNCMKNKKRYIVCCI